MVLKFQGNYKISIKDFITYLVDTYLLTWLLPPLQDANFSKCII